jgi:hypothetical protein
MGSCGAPPLYSTAIDFFEEIFHFNHAIDLLGIYCLTISIYDPFSAGATGASGFK